MSGRAFISNLFSGNILLSAFCLFTIKHCKGSLVDIQTNLPLTVFVKFMAELILLMSWLYIFFTFIQCKCWSKSNTAVTSIPENIHFYDIIKIIGILFILLFWIIIFCYIFLHFTFWLTFKVVIQNCLYFLVLCFYFYIYSACLEMPDFNRFVFPAYGPEKCHMILAVYYTFTIHYFTIVHPVLSIIIEYYIVKCFFFVFVNTNWLITIIITYFWLHFFYTNI